MFSFLFSFYSFLFFHDVFDLRCVYDHVLPFSNMCNFYLFFKCFLLIHLKFICLCSSKYDIFLIDTDHHKLVPQIICTCCD